MNRLEAHFLKAATRAVKEREQHNLSVSEIYLLFPDSTPGLKLALRSPGQPLSYVELLVYGSRPVRYHFQSESEGAPALQQLWNHCLGALSLVVEKSGNRDGRYHLFYEVSYPERDLKQLGE